MNLLKLRMRPLKDVVLKNDGITHINIYSQGRTWLGRYLSHFTRAPMETVDGHFESMEGYWYWLTYRDDQLRKLSGKDAKVYGQGCSHRFVNKLKLSHEEFMNRIFMATNIKIRSMPAELMDIFLNNQLPFIHAYVHNGEYSVQDSMKEIIEFIEVLRVRILLGKSENERCTNDC